MFSKYARLISITALLIGAPAQAQSWSDNIHANSLSDLRSNSAPVTAFARLPIQPGGTRQARTWQYGLAFSKPGSSDRGAYRGQAFQNSLRADRPLFGFELHLEQSDIGLWAGGVNGQKLISLNSTAGILHASEGPDAKKISLGSVLLIGAAAVAGLALIAATGSDNEPLLCTGNTIPNPIKGTCEPI